MDTHLPQATVREALLFSAHLRQPHPTYPTTKFVLCIAGGLLIGFTFYKTSDSLQGTQNKLFVRGVWPQ
jgi:hypothetical protein